MFEEPSWYRDQASANSASAGRPYSSPGAVPVPVLCQWQLLQPAGFCQCTSLLYHPSMPRLLIDLRVDFFLPPKVLQP